MKPGSGGTFSRDVLQASMYFPLSMDLCVPRIQAIYASSTIRHINIYNLLPFTPLSICTTALQLYNTINLLRNEKAAEPKRE
jgi:hypothetical protein